MGPTKRTVGLRPREGLGCRGTQWGWGPESTQRGSGPRKGTGMHSWVGPKEEAKGHRGHSRSPRPPRLNRAMGVHSRVGPREGVRHRELPAITGEASSLLLTLSEREVSATVPCYKLGIWGQRDRPAPKVTEKGRWVQTKLQASEPIDVLPPHPMKVEQGLSPGVKLGG